MGEIEEQVVERVAERRRAAGRAALSIVGAPAACAGREEEERVGGRGVAVDGDGVEAVPDALADSSACRTGAAIGASVTTKESIVAMSGAIMPAPLAMPLMVTVASPSVAVPRRDLRDRCRWS